MTGQEANAMNRHNELMEKNTLTSDSDDVILWISSLFPKY